MGTMADQAETRTTTVTSGCCGGDAPNESGARVESDVKEQIREHYAGRAREVLEQQKAATCSCGCTPVEVAPDDELARGLYGIDETSELPDAAVLASPGCGNPSVARRVAARPSPPPGRR